MLQKIISAVKWLGNKIVDGCLWLGSKIAGGCQSLGVKLGLITIAAPPSSAATTARVAIEERPPVRLCEALPPELEELVLGYLDQIDREEPGKAYGSYFKAGTSIEEGATTTVTTKTSTYSPLENFRHRQFYVIPKVDKLLTAVEYADYEEAKIAIGQDFSLMFKPVSFRYRDGSSEYISPLKYAFKVYDTYMWKMFYEMVKDDPVQEKEFLKQANEEMKHINLKPLFTAYEEYERQAQRWLRNEVLNQDIDREWFKLGKVQKAILPVHMLKEFSREGDTWHANSAFDVKVLPAPRNCRLYDYMAGVRKTLSSSLHDLGWGEGFSLIRGRGRLGAACWDGPAVGNVLGYPVDDLATFRRLFEVRTEDFRQLSLLSQNSLANREHQDQSSFSSSAGRVTP